MKDVAIASGASTSHTPTYANGQPRLWLVREETGSGYQPDVRTRRGDKVAGLPMAPLEQSGGCPGDDPETVSDWNRVHARVVELGAERARHERELCRWLLAADRLGVHGRAGYASLHEYAARLVGLSARQTEERLRVGRALSDLTGLDEALAAGHFCFSVVRELTRVAEPETEQEWVDWARGKTTRQVERAVAARRPGDGPRDPGDPSRLTHRLAFEVRAETMALFRDLQATVRGELGGEVDDDTLLYEIARRALGGPTDAGRSSYQVALTRCEECGQANIEAAGQSHPVDLTVVEMAACDSQQLGPVGGVPQHGSEADDHAESPHMGAIGAPAPKRRATQTIPPAVRRAVMRRDRQRCAVPGCSNHRFLDVHHLDPLAEGGRHDPERMAVLCGSHHRAVHAGSLRIDGNATAGFTFRHADGTPYGAGLHPATVDLAEQAYATLRHLGFLHGRARALVDTVIAAGAPVTLEQFVGAALRAS